MEQRGSRAIAIAAQCSFPTLGSHGAVPGELSCEELRTRDEGRGREVTACWAGQSAKTDAGATTVQGAYPKQVSCCYSSFKNS